MRKKEKLLTEELIELIIDVAKKDHYIWKFLPKNKDLVLRLLDEESVNYKSIYQNLNNRLKKDKDIITKISQRYTEVIEFVNEELLQDEEFILHIVSYAGFNDKRDILLKYIKYEGLDFIINIINKDIDDLKYLDGKVLDDKRLVFLASVYHAKTLKYASNRLRKDKKLLFDILKYSPLALKYADDELRDDKELVLNAMRDYGSSLDCASERLKDDKEIVLEFLKYSVKNFQYASDRLRDDKEIATKAIKEDSKLFIYAGDRLKKDKEFILKIGKVYNLLHYVSDELRDDKDIVLKAVKIDGYDLELASERLKRDKDVVIEAIKETIFAIKFVYCPKLLSDPDVIIYAPMEVEKRLDVTLSYANYKLFYNKKAMLDAAKYCINALNKVPFEFLNDKEFMLELIMAYKDKGDEDYLEKLKYYIGMKLRNDEEFLYKLFEIYGKEEIIAKTINIKNIIGNSILNYISEIKLKDIFGNLIMDNKKFVLEIIENSDNDFGEYWNILGDNLKKDKEIILKILEKIDSSVTVLDHIDKKLLNDKEIFLSILKKLYAYDELFEFMNKDFLKDDDFKRKVIGYADIERLRDKELVSQIKDVTFSKEDILNILKIGGYIPPKYLEGPLERLRHDKEFILEAVKLNGKAIEYADSGLRYDREVFLETVKTYCSFLLFIDNYRLLMNDKEIAFTILQNKENNPSFYYKNSDEILKDREFVLEAIKVDYSFIELIDESFYTDEEIMYEAMKSYKVSISNSWLHPIRYMDKSLLENSEFIMKLLDDGYNILSNIIDKFKYDAKKFPYNKDILLKMLKNSKSIGNNFKTFMNLLTHEHKSDPDIAYEIYKKIGSYEKINFFWKHIDQKLKNNKEFMLKVIKKSPFSVKRSNRELRKDKDIIFAAINGDIVTIRHLHNEIFSNKAIALEVMKYIRDKLYKNI